MLALLPSRKSVCFTSPRRHALLPQSRVLETTRTRGRSLCKLLAPPPTAKAGLALDPQCRALRRNSSIFTQTAARRHVVCFPTVLRSLAWQQRPHAPTGDRSALPENSSIIPATASALALQSLNSGSLHRADQAQITRDLFFLPLPSSSSACCRAVARSFLRDRPRVHGPHAHYRIFRFPPPARAHLLLWCNPCAVRDMQIARIPPTSTSPSLPYLFIHSLIPFFLYSRDVSVWP